MRQRLDRSVRETGCSGIPDAKKEIESAEHALTKAESLRCEIVGGAKYLRQDSN